MARAQASGCTLLEHHVWKIPEARFSDSLNEASRIVSLAPNICVFVALNSFPKTLLLNKVNGMPAEWRPGEN